MARIPEQILSRVPARTRADSKTCSPVASGLLLFGLTLCGAWLPAKTFAQGTPEIADGVRLMGIGQTTAALFKFNQAVEMAPRSADALTWRGICENQLQQYAAAASDFQSALRLDQTMLAAHYNLALSLIRLHKNDEALDQLRVVIAAQPNAVQPLYNMAILLEAKGSFAEAAEQLRTAHAADPDDKGVTLHLLLATVKSSQSADLSSMVSDLAAQSTAPEIERQAGTALLDAGRFPESVTLLKTARDREPSAPKIDLLLARALLGNGQSGEAIILLESGSPDAKPNEERIYLLALAYLGAGAVSKAATNFRTAATLDQKDARPLYHLGLIAESMPQGQVDAQQLLHAAWILEPANATYALALARICLAGDKAEEALTVLTRITASRDNEVQRLALMGIALAATHKCDEAVPELHKAIEADSSLALAQSVLGFCYLERGQYIQAAEAYSRASELEPGRSLYARDAALASERASLRAPALGFAQRAVALDSKNAADHALLGKLLAVDGRNDEAVQELRHAADLDPNLDSALYLLARTYNQMGDRRQAAAWSEKLSALKQRHEAEFNLQKRVAATGIRSSTLLEGGSLSADEAGVP